MSRPARIAEILAAGATDSTAPRGPGFFGGPASLDRAGQSRILSVSVKMANPRRNAALGPILTAAGGEKRTTSTEDASRARRSSKENGSTKRLGRSFY